jgi:hypothetical protein
MPDLTVFMTFLMADAALHRGCAPNTVRSLSQGFWRHRSRPARPVRCLGPKPLRSDSNAWATVAFSVDPSRKPKASF